jgi:hypothetical protein
MNGWPCHDLAQLNFAFPIQAGWQDHIHHIKLFLLSLVLCAIEIDIERINMATVRTSANEVQVDEIIYTFSDAGVADVFESCIATTGDIVHCTKDQVAIHMRPADPSKLMSEVKQPDWKPENYERNEAANYGRPFNKAE